MNGYLLYSRISKNVAEHPQVFLQAGNLINWYAFDWTGSKIEF